MGPIWVLLAPDGPMLAPQTMLSGCMEQRKNPSYYILYDSNNMMCYGYLLCCHITNTNNNHYGNILIVTEASPNCEANRHNTWMIFSYQCVVILNRQVETLHYCGINISNWTDILMCSYSGNFLCIYWQYRSASLPINCKTHEPFTAIQLLNTDHQSLPFFLSSLGTHPPGSFVVCTKCHTWNKTWQQASMTHEEVI